MNKKTSYLPKLKTEVVIPLKSNNQKTVKLIWTT